MSPSFHHDPAALRRAAEARLHAPTATRPPATEADVRRLAHELEVHQIELEMQNEELITARTALAAELQHYTELYDFAPVGYFTLSVDGTIRRLNLTGAALVGTTRAPLLGRRFGLLVAAADRAEFNAFLTRVFAGEERERCEVTLLRAGPEPVAVLLEAQRSVEESECRVVVLDITDRKQAEETQRESEARFRAVFEQAAVGVARVAPDGRWLEVNARLAAIVGYSREELLKKTFQDITHPEDLATDLGQVRQVLAGEIDHYALEKRYVRRDGSLVWINLTVSLVRDAAGAPLYFISIVEDIHDRKTMQGALGASEARFRRAVEDSPFPTLLHAEDGAILLASNSWCELSGYGREELRTIAEWTRLAYGESQPVVAADIERLYGLEHRVAEGDYTIRTKSGGRCIWEFSSAPLGRLPDGRRLVISMAMDVTERRHTEASLRLSDLALKAISQGVILTGPDQLIVTVNKAFEAISGYTLPEILGRNCRFLQGADTAPATIEAIRESLRQGTEFAGEILNYRKDGTPFWNDLTISPVRDAAGQVSNFIGVTRDITPRREAEAEVRRLNAELEQRVSERTAQLEAANRELEAFSYSVSHDLRAPLRGMHGYVRMLQEDYGPQLDAEGNRLIAVVTGEAQRMGRLIDDLLAFSHLGRQSMGRGAVDVTALVRAVFGQITQTLPGPAPRLELPPLPPAHGDPAMLRQVLVNLLGNAVKFSRHQTAPVITVGATAEAGHPIYFVQDNGVGFDEKYAQKLFGVFQRLHSEAEFEGTGVGLAIVQRVIHRHGGRVWAESKPGAGATFFFTLPPPGDSPS